MKLGIEGRRALICASSRGLGRACAEALAAEGVNVVLNGRDPERLAQTTKELSEAYDVEVTSVVADITTPEGRDALLAACPSPDILINNNAGPKPKTSSTVDHDGWIEAFEANTIAALVLINAVLPAMRERKFGRIVNITSMAVKLAHPLMGVSTGPRAALTAISKGISLEVMADNVTINNLLPERFDTDRQLFMAQFVMDAEGISYEEARRRQEEGVAAKRLGRPEELGATCAFFCSDFAGFASGNNVHLDGGSFIGSM